MSLARVADIGSLPERLRGGVIAIGNFDGVHRGHRAVLDRALAEAASVGAPALVLTFEPHPRAFFRPEEAPCILTPPAMKARLVGLLGFDGIVTQAFDAGFAARSAENFVDDILYRGLGVRHVVTGYDFHFGRNRQGTPDFLRAAGDRMGFGVSLVEPFRDEGGEVISSSRIRDLLKLGDPAQAAGLLGYRYSVEAEIVAGKQLGRTLGFPTANMVLPASMQLGHGIYAVRYRRPDGSLHDGVASYGRRPTVDIDGAPLLETFLFDFAGDLYGETATVSFFGFLRGEEKFDGLDALTAQMNRDAEEARALLSGVRPLSEIDLALAFTS